jgi:hypothetical protein
MEKQAARRPVLKAIKTQSSGFGGPFFGELKPHESKADQSTAPTLEVKNAWNCPFLHTSSGHDAS